MSRANNKSLNELSDKIPHNKVGVTTVDEVRAAGGDVISSPTKGIPNHSTFSGITLEKAEELMNPTQKSPSKN